MSRYIDADLMREKAYQMNFGGRISERELFLFNRALSEMPTVDAVPVVRCGECIHRYVDGENVRFNVCELNHNKVQADDWYCADGERRTDEQQT